jgi:hypothetical protein
MRRGDKTDAPCGEHGIGRKAPSLPNGRLASFPAPISRIFQSAMNSGGIRIALSFFTEA